MEKYRKLITRLNLDIPDDKIDGVIGIAKRLSRDHDMSVEEAINKILMPVAMSKLQREINDYRIKSQF